MTIPRFRDDKAQYGAYLLITSGFFFFMCLGLWFARVGFVVLGGFAFFFFFFGGMGCFLILLAVISYFQAENIEQYRQRYPNKQEKQEKQDILDEVEAAKRREEMIDIEQEAKDRLKKEQEEAVADFLKAEPQNRISMSENEDELCKICFTKKMDTLVTPCGHLGLCFDCASDMKEKNQPCPFCRGLITDIIKSFQV